LSPAHLGAAEGRDAGLRIQRQTGAEAAALLRARQALAEGDLATAWTRYEELAALEPDNRDVLLGRAAIAVARRQPALAVDAYRRLLAHDPGDVLARAALISLQPDLDRQEGELRLLLERHPHEDSLHFLLGILCAGQGRWPEARRYFAAALEFVPDNGDAAFNLAVSLEHLRDHRGAAVFYGQALESARQRPVLFPRDRAAERLRALREEERP
jgi:Flp pilus assembly protein TadD